MKKQGGGKKGGGGSGGHGHSHGGEPCSGHHESEDQTMEQLNDILKQFAQLQTTSPPGHGHSHGGKPCTGHHEPPQEHGHSHGGGGHGHSHGGKPCTGDHGEAQEHGHSHGGGGHGHSHGGHEYDDGSDDDLPDPSLAALASKRQEVYGNNPSMPLIFEEANSEGPPFNPSMGYVPPNWIDEPLNEPSIWASTKVLKAHQKASQAYRLVYKDPIACEREAREALQMSPICPEAYCVLALCVAKTYDEALEFFRKGVEVGVKAGKQNWNEALKEGSDLYTYHCWRPVFRSQLGVANTLRKLGRLEDALKAYLVLHQWDDNWSSKSSWVNYSYHIPEVYMRLGKWEEAIAYMRKNSKGFASQSSAAAYYFSLALCHYVTKPQIRNKFDPPLGQPKKGLPTQGAMFLACNINCFIPSFLSGELPLPSGRIPFSINIGPHSREAAINYVRSSLDLWKVHPGAIEWAVKHNNFVLITEAFDPANYNERIAHHTSKDFESWASNCYINDSVRSYENPLFIAVQRQNLEYLKILLQKGANPDGKRKEGLSPLHPTCYYDTPPIFLETLIEAGGTVHAPSEFWARSVRVSPLEMAVNQGNWRQLEVILKKKPNLFKNRSLLRTLFEGCTSTSVFGCLETRGIGGKCQRCVSGDQPHSKEASFYKIVDFLVGQGFCLEDVNRSKAPNAHPLVRYAKSLLSDPKGASSSASSPSGTSAPTPNCGVCGLPASQFCARCKKTRYCSRECQTKDWPLHKQVCKAT